MYLNLSFPLIITLTYIRNHRTIKFKSNIYVHRPLATFNNVSTRILELYDHSSFYLTLHTLHYLSLQVPSKKIRITRYDDNRETPAGWINSNNIPKESLQGPSSSLIYFYFYFHSFQIPRSASSSFRERFVSDVIPGNEGRSAMESLMVRGGFTLAKRDGERDRPKEREREGHTQRSSSSPDCWRSCITRVWQDNSHRAILPSHRGRERLLLLGTSTSSSDW